MTKLRSTLLKSSSVKSSPPIWLMRQAGRYLPEFKEIRKKAGTFLDLCYNPKLASEVTLQPLKRFDLDAAIVFADILLLPHALGLDVEFVSGKGPVMTPLNLRTDLNRLEKNDFINRLEPVFATINLVRDKLDTSKSLIGFCGAPWTVATYMITGSGSSDHLITKQVALTHPEEFATLVNILTECSLLYLEKQIIAGADVIQIFDSWSGILDEEMFNKFSLQPIARMVKYLKQKYPEVAVIAFPKNAGLRLKNFCQTTNVDGISIDWSCPLNYIRDEIQPVCCVQGNIDPVRLMVGGDALRHEVERLVGVLGQGSLVINLGHGVLPQTPPENVSKLIAMIKGQD